MQENLNKKHQFLITVLSIFFMGVFIVSGVFASNLRNNNNFINDAFRRNNPTDTQIKEAVFGNISDTNTAYTQGRRSNPCSTGTINIINVQNYTTSGLNSVPLVLASNTIYVLQSGSYITTGEIDFLGSCTAVIGKGKIKIYSNTILDTSLNSAIFKTKYAKYSVLDNMTINSLSDGLGNYRNNGTIASGNSYGIYIYKTTDTTFHGLNIAYGRMGIQLESSSGVQISDVVIYNTYLQGLYIYGCPYSNIINNVQSFNNNGNGIIVKLSTGQSLSNIQSYNNKGRGIQFEYTNNSVITNSMSYSNYSYGINFLNGSSNNIIHDSWFYNNGTTGVIVQNGDNNKYYGSLVVFNNITNPNGNIPTGMISGSSEDPEISSLGRSDGILIDTGLVMGYPYITNPKTDDGRDLISSTHWTSTNRSNVTWTGIEFINFTYGTGILKQTVVPGYNSPNFLFTSIPYTSYGYIAQTEYYSANPDDFSFINITGAELNQLYTSNNITLTGMDESTIAYVNIRGRGNIIKNGSDIGTSGTGTNGDQFAIQMVSSSNYYTLRSGSLLIGTTSADFTITTFYPLVDNIPDTFSFDDITGAELNQPYTSDNITLTGMDDGIEIDMILTGRGNIIKNGSDIGTSGTGTNGDQFAIQMISSSSYYTVRYATLFANTISSTFGVSTIQDLIFPIFTGVESGHTYNEPLRIYFSDNNLSGATLNGEIYESGTLISYEGDYIFEVTDTAGNTTGATFRISIPKTITITFDATIDTGIVHKAAIKYNKDVAYGMVYDDGLNDGYQPVFEYLNGGIVSGGSINFIAPGLYSTDGAGNDVAFKGGYAWYSVNSAWSDLHINTPSYMTWSQLREAYQNGWDIINHGRSSAAYPTLGQTYTYPDNPPGTTGLDYAYEIQKNYAYVRDRIGLSGVYMTHFILPSGDPGYTQPAWDQGYKSVSSQNITYGSTGINISTNLDLYHFQMHREFVTSQNSTMGTVTNDIDTLITNSSSPTTKLWRQSFTHGVVLTGDTSTTNGGMEFDLWKYLMDHIADNYGKLGSDNIWFAGPQEVYEYIATKQGTNIDTIISGNQLIINLDTLSVPSDLRRKSLSLLITGTNANISSITYQNGAFTYHSENKSNGLINIEMGDYYLTDRNPDAFNLGTETDANTGETYNSNIITLTGMSPELSTIIYLSGLGTLYKNGSNVGSSSTGKNGDQFYVRLLASDHEGTTTSTLLHIGLQSQTYTITTKVPSYKSDMDSLLRIPTNVGFDNIVYTTTLQNDRKILVGGDFTTYDGITSNKIIRLFSDGRRDTSFDSGLGFNDSVRSIVVQDDGKIVVGGFFTTYQGISANRIIRLNADGSRDDSFVIGSGFNIQVRIIAMQNDGKLLVGGAITNYNGTTIYRIARLNTNGSIDTSFNIGLGFNNNIRAIAFQEDGKIILGGGFVIYSGTVTNRIIRINPDGSRDDSFVIGSGFNEQINVVKIDSDGKILVGGFFTGYNGTPVNRIARLNTNGSIDTSFDSGNGFDAQVVSLTTYNNKILVGGEFTSYNSSPANKFISLNENGSRDTSFDIGIGFTDSVRSINVQTDGKILVGGDFTGYQGTSFGRLIRLHGNSLISVLNTTNTDVIYSEFTSKGYTLSGSLLSGSSPMVFIDSDGKVPVALNIKNNNILLTLPQNIQIKNKSNNQTYTGTFFPPTTIVANNLPNTISAINVGATGTALELTNGVATLSIPVDGVNIGDMVNIYSSEDNGSTWQLHDNTTITEYNNQPYVIFTTTHFTDFAIVGSTGSFVINNDAATTTSGEVTLNIYAPGAQNMRFSNDGVSWSTREAYATTKAWTLSAGYATKTVYAQFDTDGDNVFEAEVNDTILYTDGSTPSCPVGSHCGDITLRIISGYSYCEYGTTLDFGQTGHSYAARSLMTGFLTTSGNAAWFCEDNQGFDSRNLTIQASDIVNTTTNNITHTINASHVFIKNPDAYISQGVCTSFSGSSHDNRIDISTAQSVLGKDGSFGEGCKITTDTLDLKIDLDAGQAVGLYSGTLTISLPNF